MPNVENLPVPHDELALKFQQDDHQYKYGIAALEIQERDREAIRKHERNSQKMGIYFLICVGVIFLIITVVAFYFDKEAFLVECLKYITVFFGGSGVGYVSGYCKKQKA